MTIFVDTAVVMYAGGAEHPLRSSCRALLGLVASRHVDAVTSAEVIQEILHRFSRADGVLGDRMARAALELFGPVLPVTHDVLDRSRRLLTDYPALSARDTVHVATCIMHGIGHVVSPDVGLDAVREVARIDPTDEQGWRALP